MKKNVLYVPVSDTERIYVAHRISTSDWRLIRQIFTGKRWVNKGMLWGIIEKPKEADRPALKAELIENFKLDDAQSEQIVTFIIPVPQESVIPAPES